MKSNNHHISTDDLAFSAYLKLRGYRIIKSEPIKSKNFFTFDIPTEESHRLKVEFINSEFLSLYNELRNLKKLI